jgi:ATP-dependent Clp protease ATP-binding subunit ClpA
MREQFNDQGRHVIVTAQEEARRLKHNYVGTEHLLLGLISEGQGVGAKALQKLGVTHDKAFEQVERIVGYGEEGTEKKATFTVRAKKVLDLATREAIQLTNNYVSTEHLLLGLVREGEGVAARVLANLGASPDKVRKAVFEHIGPAQLAKKRAARELVLKSIEEDDDIFKAYAREAAAKKASVPHGQIVAGRLHRMAEVLEDEAARFARKAEKKRNEALRLRHAIVLLLEDEDETREEAS